MATVLTLVLSDEEHDMLEGVVACGYRNVEDVVLTALAKHVQHYDIPVGPHFNRLKRPKETP